MRKECMNTSTGVIRMASASKISAQTYGTKQHFILSELYSIFSKGYWKFLAKGIIYLSVTGTGSGRKVLKNIFFNLSCYFPQKMNKKGWKVKKNHWTAYEILNLHITQPMHSR